MSEYGLIYLALTVLSSSTVIVVGSDLTVCELAVELATAAAALLDELAGSWLKTHQNIWVVRWQSTAMFYQEFLNNHAACTLHNSPFTHLKYITRTTGSVDIYRGAMYMERSELHLGQAKALLIAWVKT